MTLRHHAKKSTRRILIPGLTLVQGLEIEILSELAREIERVLLKTNLNAHSMLGLYTMSYDTSLYFEYTREFFCVYSHVHTGTKTTKLSSSKKKKKVKFTVHTARVDPTVNPVPMGHN